MEINNGVLEKVSKEDFVEKIVGDKTIYVLNIPEGVEKISRFVQLKQIKFRGEVEVNCPSTLTEIEEHVFDSAPLSEIKLSKNLKTIGREAFTHCYLLKNIELPDSLTSIEDSAFSSSALQKVKLPKGLQKINQYLFSSCISLKEVVIPETVTKIENSAFSCTALKSVEIPESVTSIGKKAFEYCSNIEQINLSKNVNIIGDHAFTDCKSLGKVTMQEGIKEIGSGAFSGCTHLKELTIPSSVESVGSYVVSEVQLEKAEFPNSIDAPTIDKFEFIYLKKDGSGLYCSQQPLKDASNYLLLNADNVNTFDANYRKNLLTFYNLKVSKKFPFIPPDFTLKEFPNDQIENYYKNNNHQRWGKLVRELNFLQLQDNEKNNSLTDLMKIYYSIGGFSENQGESERAYEYVKKYVARVDDANYSPSEAGDRIHQQFSKIILDNRYNKDFAAFFMKYYKDNPKFMEFSLGESKYFNSSKDYLCSACNNFSAIQKAYPNRVVNGNNDRDMLSPKFVAEHCTGRYYKNVLSGNEEFSLLIGKYGYSQRQFDQMQEIYEIAKQQKDKYVIHADKSSEEDCVSFNFLEKDDPLGFVLGDITNCCQHIGGEGESCVDDGYTNPEAGFLIFEEKIKDEKGNETGETRILAQAYIWYDPQTKTICYDNIEIPTKILEELKKQSSKLKVGDLLKAVENSAEAVIKGMNKNGEIKVERVTTGAGYNDLKRELEAKYEAEDNPRAKHRSYGGYSDANQKQYIIKNYSDVVDKTSQHIEINLKETAKNLKELSAFLKEMEVSTNERNR